MSAEQMRRYREAHPERKDRDRALSNARRQALNQLADLHPAEFVVLLDVACAALGVEPPAIGPAGRTTSRGSGGAR